MSTNLLRIACLIFLFSSCISTSHNSNQHYPLANTDTAVVQLPDSIRPLPLTDLPRTEEGGFVLSPGYYEADFKTYCLQPGTPDPTPRDAYLQAPITGYRSTIVQSVLDNSRSRPAIEQRHVQLLLWSIVSGADFNKLAPDVRSDARRLLTSKQIFELQGGVLGMIKTVSNQLPSGNSQVKRLFDAGISSYEKYEKIAVLSEPSQVYRADFKNDQWYRQKENYYVRYLARSYKNVKIQVYVPDTLSIAKGEYLVFDPTAMQVIPANSNSQRLGIGGTVVDIIREVIKINKPVNQPKRVPQKKEEPTVKTDDKKLPKKY